MNVDSRFTPPLRQRGNTLVGIIIGLVIGLVIAVIVALVITKGATPFTDKGKMGKAGEPTPGQAADPNKPMYGNKQAAKEAARDFLREPKEPAEAGEAREAKEAKAPPADVLQQAISKLKLEPARVARPEPKPAAAPAPAEPKVAAEPKAAPEPKPAAEPKVAAVEKAKPAPAAAPKADAADEKWIYYLQVGAFRETADAESARAKLALLGFEAAVTERSTDTGVLHRVRMGPYNQVEAMNRARSKLSDNGVDVAVVRNQK